MQNFNISHWSTHIFASGYTLIINMEHVFAKLISSAPSNISMEQIGYPLIHEKKRGYKILQMYVCGIKFKCHPK